ncbi:hypothetical protein [Leucobacter sp. M11]|uniref:hypothetical protein n=1 Tax=Leucobacter sp. M11 TaxID=2993565 RepID=UPI002D80B558|nr:hypothetical protein [Leucobacter sp. M11]MEB4613719.1 hypothetical protein [Leucobacter sp. M11]
MNRIILLVTGLILLASGAAAATAMLSPVAGEVWRTSMTTTRDWMVHADQATRISEATTASWFTVALLALLLLVVVLAIVVIARLGGGRSSRVIREEACEGVQGAVTIRHGFAVDAITRALTGREEILSARVDTRRVRGADVLHVSVTPRQNTSPADVAGTVTMLVDNLATLTGRETPTLVSIRSGIRSRLAADQSRVN